MFIFVLIKSFQQSRNTGQMTFKCGKLYVQCGIGVQLEFVSKGRKLLHIAQNLIVKSLLDFYCQDDYG